MTDTATNYDKLSPAELDALLAERNLTVTGTGADGNILKKDRVQALKAADETTAPDPAPTGDDVTDTATTPPADTAKSSKGKVKIDRISEETGTWWCPVDDRSHASLVTVCDGCGAVRDGDHVVRKG